MHFAVDVILLKLEIFESVNPSILANIIADAFTMKRFDSCFKIKFFNRDHYLFYQRSIV